MLLQNCGGGRGVLCFDRTAGEEGSFNFNIAAADGGSSLHEQNSSEWWAVAWTEEQRREESSMRGQNSSVRRAQCLDRTAAGGRRAQCVDRTAAEGGEFYDLTELQQREGSFML